jgi:glycosyltransferase involved in cell wall biosynthesis
VSSTVHLVYPAASAISCPDAIGRNLATRLAKRHRVVHHEWDTIGLVRPGPDDVLLGHPHPAPWTIFRMSARMPGWKKILVLCPYAHGSKGQVAFLHSSVRRAHRYLAITGPYWWRRVDAGPFAAWKARMEPIDLALDRGDFPRIKGNFGEPGKRRFLYVGNTAPPKNVRYLSAIARAMPDVAVSWAGSGSPIEGVRPLGVLDFSSGWARDIVAGHDFLLTVGNSDANPTTVLEAMAWGLVPVCTPQSGYESEAGIVNVPLDDVKGAVEVLRQLQSAPAADLEALRAINDRELDRRYTWDRFAGQVEAAIDSEIAPAAVQMGTAERVGLAMASLGYGHSPIRPRNALNLLRTNVARVAARVRGAGVRP